MYGGVIGFSDGENVVESVPLPLDKTNNWLWIFWFNSRINDEEVAKLANEVVVLLKFGFYGLMQKIRSRPLNKRLLNFVSLLGIP